MDNSARTLCLNDLVRKCSVILDNMQSLQSPPCDLQVTHDEQKNMSTIEPNELFHLIANKRDILIVDCRFDYEYQAGHIQNAKNVTPKDIPNFYSKLKKKQGQSQKIIVFHCEFSKVRGPLTLKYFRAFDILQNIDKNYQVSFPFVYLLKGGYSNYFKKILQNNINKTQVTSPMARMIPGIYSKYFKKLEMKDTLRGEQSYLPMKQNQNAETHLIETRERLLLEIEKVGYEIFEILVHKKSKRILH